MTQPFAGIGRNDPCYCGSGKKVKKCCGERRSAQVVTIPIRVTIGDVSKNYLARLEGDDADRYMKLDAEGKEKAKAELLEGAKRGEKEIKVFG